MSDFGDLHKDLLKHAAKECITFSNEALLPEHYLLSLLNVGWGIAHDMLMVCSIDKISLQKELMTRLEVLDHKVFDSRSEEILFSKEFEEVLECSVAISRDFGSRITSTEHILFAMCTVDCFVKNLLKEFDIDVDRLQFSYDKLYTETYSDGPADLVAVGIGEQQDTSSDSLLSVFGKDLNNKYREGKVGKVLCRDKEIERLIHVLCRMKKNNPLLVGDAGVGKTAILEGLAAKIVRKETPKELFNKKVILLDLAMIVAGTKYRGEFEQRLKNIIREVEKDPNIILAIDEIHTIVSAGAAEGSMDAANILKPSLSQGDFQCVGCTTWKDYKRALEPDAALSRRFSVIKVDEPSKADALTIIKGVAEQYENFHGIKFTEEVLEYIVNVSSRYIPDKKFPDKAIDIIDEVGSKKKLHNIVKNDVLDNIENDIMSVEQNIVNLIKSKDWPKCKEEQKKRDKLYILLNKEENKIIKNVSKSKTAITIDNVAEVVSGMTGIPIPKNMDDVSNLKSIKQDLGAFVKGQEEAVNAVSKAVIRGATGLKSPKKPIATLLFAGQTGVGKTETAKKLAKLMFGDESAVIREDMSSYSEKHSISGLVGCFTGDMKVLTKQGEKEISNINVGDLVLTHVGEYKKVVDKYEYDYERSKHNNILEIVLDQVGTNKVRCTADHKILTYSNSSKKVEWTEARSILPGRDFALFPKGKEEAPEKKSTIATIITLIPIVTSLVTAVTGLVKVGINYFKSKREYDIDDTSLLNVSDYYKVPIISVDISAKEETKVYDLSIEEHKSYTVSMIAVHNSPPGYVGFDDGGKLPNRIKQKPYSIVLLDEIEKADPKVWEVFLPMFDEGRLIDKKTGESVDCKNTIIILTTNLGSQIGDNDIIGFDHNDDMVNENYIRIQERTMNSIKSIMNPEILNRIDEIVVFKALSKEAVRDIVDLIINEYNDHFKEIRGFTIKLEDSLKDHIIEHGYSSEYGARNIRRHIDNIVLDELASFYVQHSDENDIIGKRIRAGAQVICKLNKDKSVIFSVVPDKKPTIKKVVAKPKKVITTRKKLAVK